MSNRITREVWSAVLVAQYHFKGLGVVGLEIHFHRRSAFWKSIYRRWPYTCRRLGAFLATASKKKQQTNKKKLGYHSVRSNGSTSARASGNGGVGNKLCRKNPPDGAVTCPLDGPAPDAVNQKKKENTRLFSVSCRLEHEIKSCTTAKHRRMGRTKVEQSHSRSAEEDTVVKRVWLLLDEEDEQTKMEKERVEEKRKRKKKRASQS